MVRTRLNQSITQLLHTPLVLVRFLRETRAELRKVTWPVRRATVTYTIIVIVSSLVIGAVTGGLDYLLSLLVQFIVS